MLRSFITCLLFILILPAKNFALAEDSIPAAQKRVIKTKISYSYEKDFIYGNSDVYTIDTTVSQVHRLSPLLDLHYNYPGTAGSAGMQQQFNFINSTFTYTGLHCYDLQMLISDSIKSFRTNKRYTEVTYQNGSFKEQSIAVLHSQNITRTWNAGLIFDRQGVNDYMKFSDTYRSRFALFTSYHTPNNRYNLFAQAIWNTVINGVNGGLVSDSLFDNTNVTNIGIQGLAFRISNAEEHERRKFFYLSQYYDFGKTERDSSGNIIAYKPVLRLNYKASFERKSFVYKDQDPDTSFYQSFFYGYETYDSLHTDELTNRVALQVPADTSLGAAFFRNWSAGIFAEYKNINYGQRTDSTWDDFSAGANIFLKTDSASPEIFSEASYVYTGIDRGNYKAELRAYSPTYSFGRFGIHVSTGQSAADLIYRWSDANNFIWKNSFSPVSNIQAGFNYELRKYNFKIEASHIRIENYVFLNSFAFPDQFFSTISVNKIAAVKNFRYRFWHFDNTIVYQNTDHQEIIHLPEFITDQAVYFQKHYSHDAVLLALGLSANYNSSYYADGFMPSNGLFFLQNSVKVGGYLRFDFFINAQIKTARFFFKIENVADNLLKDSYYLIPHYPMPGRVLKFGIVWRFFDQ